MKVTARPETDEMSVTVEQNNELLDGGPPRRLQMSLGLIKPGDLRIARRARLVVLVGWAPLLLLTILQSLFFRNNAAKSFFSDFAVHARSLVAAPLFVLAEAECIPRLGKVARHFLDASLITEPDRANFDLAVTSTQRLVNSRAGELIVVGFTYALILAVWIYTPPGLFPDWHRSAAPYQDFSFAKWWHVLVSIPLLLLLFFGWLWRILLWGRFLWLTSRLDLRLIPGHPDHAGGLMFLGNSLRAFWMLSFALGAIVAGTIANRAVHHGMSLEVYKNGIIALLIFVLILFVGPLLVFMKKLYMARRRGIFEYGALAGEVGLQFERKWLNREGGVDEGALDVPDFSSTVDLYQVVANVYEMKYLPFDLKNLGMLVATMLLPFVPVVLMIIPLEEIIKDLVKLLI
jgi:hypothetical protein